METPLTFGELQAIMGKLHFPAARPLLAAAGLAAFTERYTAYEATYYERRLCVLIAKAVKLGEAKSFGVLDLSRYVVVLERTERQTWARAWPGS
jgi:hypothetical protein